MKIVIIQIDRHIACAVSGLVPDSRTLVDFARSESQGHRFTYDEPIGLFAITQAVSDIALNFGEGDITTERKPIVFDKITAGPSLWSRITNWRY